MVDSRARLERAMRLMGETPVASNPRKKKSAEPMEGGGEVDGKTYGPEEVIDEIRDVEGMDDPDLHDWIRAFPRWRLVRWPVDRFSVRDADRDMVKDYVRAGPAHAPPSIAVPGTNGLHDLMDGAHRRAAAAKTGDLLLAFVALDPTPDWIRRAMPTPMI